jgi:DNA-binding IclR family transcriptional regulator
MDWLLIQAEERRRTEEDLVDVNTMRKKVQELLRQHPSTASSLGQTLRRDRSQVRKLLLRMEHQGLVTCTPEQRGESFTSFGAFSKAKMDPGRG